MMYWIVYLAGVAFVLAICAYLRHTEVADGDAKGIPLGHAITYGLIIAALWPILFGVIILIALLLG
jgi:hypothetical protein